MVGLVRFTRYVLALASPAPPAPLPRSGFVHRPHIGHYSGKDVRPKLAISDDSRLSNSVRARTRSQSREDDKGFRFQ